MDRFPIDGRPMYVSGYNPHEKGERSEFRYAVGLEKNKIFVQNVHFDATPEQLRVSKWLRKLFFCLFWMRSIVVLLILAYFFSPVRLLFAETEKEVLRC